MKNSISNRRGLLKAGIGACFMAGALPLLPSMAIAKGLNLNTGKKLPRLILFEMFGGNDNLNTLVPYRDELYSKLRPTIGLKKSEISLLDDELALNKALDPLIPAWEEGELAVIQDVGYQGATLSHFRSIEQIEKSPIDGKDNNGWIARTLIANPELTNQSHWDLNAVWAGGHLESMSGGDIVPYSPSTGVFNKYLNSYNQSHTRLVKNKVNQTILSYAELVANTNKKLVKEAGYYDLFHSYDPTEFEIGSQCIDVLRFIENGINAPVFKLGMSGFDMHSHLRGAHEDILNRTARNLQKLRFALKELGEWDNTVILAFSEFGRRPKENASGGTDHGSAGPMFLLGGRVNGGIKGSRADLEKLDENGNIEFTTDYKSVFSAIVSDWWLAKSNPFIESGILPMKSLFT